MPSLSRKVKIFYTNESSKTTPFFNSLCNDFKLEIANSFNLYLVFLICLSTKSDVETIHASKFLNCLFSFKNQTKKIKISAVVMP